MAEVMYNQITQEIELKYMLTYKRFTELKEKLKKEYPDESVFQINYYYDTEDFFVAKTHNTLRIRQYEEKLTLQYKHNKTKTMNIRICDEYEREITKLPKSIDLDGKTCLLLGSLITERHLFWIDKKTNVSMDKNYYLGILDYEMEIEFEEIPQLSSILNLEDAEVSEKGKYHRFLEEYEDNANFIMPL